MHRYEELEKKYYKYKLKKVIGASLFILLGIGSLFYYTFYNKRPSLKQENNISLDIKKDKIDILEFNNSSVKNLKEDKDSNKTSTLMLSFNIPKLEELKKEELRLKNKKQNNLNQKSSNDSNLSKLDSNSSKIDSNLSKLDSNSSKIKSDEKKDNKFSIKEEKVNLNLLIKKFSTSPSFETAIQIAKLYFEKDDLKNSQQWALKANSIDPRRYESWELFALILIKKGENKKAKEVLNIYLNDYGYNEKIEKLLKSLK